MEGLKKGFYTTSKKQERKPETEITQTPAKQQESHLSGTQTREEYQQARKSHELTPASQEKPRKQPKSALHQETSEVYPSGQMSVEQLIKVVLSLQQEVKKLKRENTKLMDLIEQQDTRELRMANWERELDNIWKHQQEQMKNMNDSIKTIQEQNKQIIQSQSQVQEIPKIEKMDIEEEQVIKMTREKRIKKKCYFCGSYRHLYRKCRKFTEYKREYWIREKKEREMLYCSAEGNIYKKRWNQRSGETRISEIRKKGKKEMQIGPRNINQENILQTYFTRR